MSIHKPSNKTSIHAPLGDERLHIDSGMPDKRPLSASGTGHADSDFPDRDYTAGTIPNLRPLPDKMLKHAAQKADEDISQ
jgi:hypothetical protein